MSKDKEIETHPLAGFIPDEFFNEDYIGREIAGIEDLAVLEAAHAEKHNVLLYGPTGSAKTSFVYAYAASKGLPVINVACNGAADIRQLLGGWSPKEDGGYHFVPGDLVLGIMHGAVILLNEVNFMPPKIAAVLFAVLDRRRTIYLPDAAGSDIPTMIKAHPECLFVADYNPGYQGTRVLNEAFKNRFAIKIPWGYDEGVEDQLLSSTALLELGTKLRERIDAGDLITPIPTNALMEFEDFAWNEALGFDFAVENFVAMFAPEEQQVVREVFEIHSHTIQNELGLTDHTESEKSGSDETEESEEA